MEYGERGGFMVVSQNVVCPNFAKREGLVTVVAQDAKTGEVLMVAYTDKAGFLETLKTGKAVYFSTSRQKRWMKGEESGNTQKVVDVLVDCDGDAIIYKVEQTGSGACHTEARSCFYRSVINGQLMPAPKAGEKEALPVALAEIHDDFLPHHG